MERGPPPLSKESKDPSSLQLFHISEFQWYPLYECDAICLTFFVCSGQNLNNYCPNKSHPFYFSQFSCIPPALFLDWLSNKYTFFFIRNQWLYPSPLLFYLDHIDLVTCLWHCIILANIICISKSNEISYRTIWGV